MFYLTTHSHILFKDHSDSERGNPLPPNLIIICANYGYGHPKDFFYTHHFLFKNVGYSGAGQV